MNIRDTNLPSENIFVLVNDKLKATDQNGIDRTSEIGYLTRRKANTHRVAIGLFKKRDGNGTQWRLVPVDRFNASKSTNPMPPAPALNLAKANEQANPLKEKEAEPNVEIPSDHKEIINFVKGSYTLKPVGLVMNEIKWKYLVRSACRGKNILLVGPSGAGKTLAAKSLVKALGRDDKFFYFNLGSTQDPRAALIGNTHFKKESGTFFNESQFIQAIRTPDAIVLLDELTRAHPDAWNILMTVLDELQRYVRLDEKEGSETVKVAKGVTFVATANIGNEYTATRVMDRALTDRFAAIIEVDTLNKEQEFGLLKFMFPQADAKMLETIAEITVHTRDAVKQDGGKLTNSLSTRSAVEMAGLVHDDFTLAEIAEAVIYPHFSADGGADSERTYVKQLLQKFVVDEKSGDKLFDKGDGKKKDPLPF